MQQRNKQVLILLFYMLVAFILHAVQRLRALVLTLSVWRQEGHSVCQKSCYSTKFTSGDPVVPGVMLEKFTGLSKNRKWLLLTVSVVVNHIIITNVGLISLTNYYVRSAKSIKQLLINYSLVTVTSLIILLITVV